MTVTRFDGDALIGFYERMEESFVSWIMTCGTDSNLYRSMVKRMMIDGTYKSIRPEPTENEISQV